MAFSVADLKLYFERAKPFIIVWCIVRVFFASGILGKAATAAAAAGLAFVCKSMPALVPGPFAVQLKKLDDMSSTSNKRLLLALGIDAAGIALALFEPRWLRVAAGGAGFAPVAAFVFQYVFSLPPVTAALALEESGILPQVVRVLPTATAGWAIKEGISSPRGLWSSIKAALAGVGIKL